jgi:hypothetical protein
LAIVASLGVEKVVRSGNLHGQPSFREELFQSSRPSANPSGKLASLGPHVLARCRPGTGAQRHRLLYRQR